MFRLEKIKIKSLENKIISKNLAARPRPRLTVVTKTKTKTARVLVFVLFCSSLIKTKILRINGNRGWDGGGDLRSSRGSNR